MFLKLSSPINW